jgi:hypothetical protein
MHSLNPALLTSLPDRYVGLGEPETLFIIGRTRSGPMPTPFELASNLVPLEHRFRLTKPSD